MIELNKEAIEYYNNNIDVTNIPREHYEWEIITLMQEFVANSKYVKQQILQAQIDILYEFNSTASIVDRINKLQQELKQYEQNN